MCKFKTAAYDANYIAILTPGPSIMFRFHLFESGNTQSKIVRFETLQ
jgi:hypothetical protein